MSHSGIKAATTFLTVFAHFDLLTVGVLVAGDLDEGLGLGDALLLHIDPAEFLGDGLQHPGALDVGEVVAVVVEAVTERNLTHQFYLERKIFFSFALWED